MTLSISNFSQLLSTASGFLAVSIPMRPSKLNNLETLIMVIGYLTFAIILLLTLQLLIFNFDEVNKSIVKLRESAEDLEDINIYKAIIKVEIHNALL